MRLAFGHYKLDTMLYELRCDGVRCPIEPQVFNVLAYLAEHRDRIVSRQELLDTLWTGRIVTDATLSSRIKAARRAVGDNGRAQACIATIYCRGYRFVAHTTAARVTAGPPCGRQTALLPRAPTCEPDRPFIVVIPFAYRHGDENAAWIAHALGEDLSMQLARIPGFILVSRNSTADFRAGEAGVRESGPELGSSYLVKGSIEVGGNRLYVSVQLIETTGGRVLWAERAECSADCMAMRNDDLVRGIIGRIEPALDRAELASLGQRRLKDSNPWALYRQAHATMGVKGWNEQSFNECAALMRQAIAGVPQLAFVHAYLALVLAIGHRLGLVAGPGWREEARAVAERAMALDNHDPDGLCYAGFAFADMGDLHRGLGMLRQALELDPNNAQAHAALGAALLQSGDERGLEEIRHGLRISPGDNRRAVWGTLMAHGLLDFGRISEAIQVADNACRCDDTMLLPRVVLTAAYSRNGERELAQAVLDDAHRIRPGLSRAEIDCFMRPAQMASLQHASR